MGNIRRDCEWLAAAVKPVLSPCYIDTALRMERLSSWIASAKRLVFMSRGHVGLRPAGLSLTPR